MRRQIVAIAGTSTDTGRMIAECGLKNYDSPIRIFFFLLANQSRER